MLCFLTATFENTAVKHLKSAVLGFYDADELNAAKRLLLHEVNNVKKDIHLPHIPDRREGESRAVRIVDDIFIVYTELLMTHLDEDLKLTPLPK